MTNTELALSVAPVAPRIFSSVIAAWKREEHRYLHGTRLPLGTAQVGTEYEAEMLYRMMTYFGRAGKIRRRNSHNQPFRRPLRLHVLTRRRLPKTAQCRF